MNDTLLPIGRFARLARLSVKQLRHYADLGLLPPAWTDPDSGYRYYHPDQARDAMAIGLLRSLDVPLAAISDVLAGADLPDALGGVRDRLDAELDRRRPGRVVRIFVDQPAAADAVHRKAEDRPRTGRTRTTPTTRGGTSRRSQGERRRS